MEALTENTETASALAELGLTEEILAEAIRRGEQLRNNLTQHHPKTAGGFYVWSEVTAALRNLLVPLGGEAKNERGLELCLCPTRGDVIAVLTGDTATGDPTRNPQPKYTKNRPTAQYAIESSQMELFQQHVITKAGPRLWFLLVRRDKDVAIAELSRPAAIAEGRIVKWDARILLRPVPADSATPTKDGEYTTPVVIEVTPRD